MLYSDPPCPACEQGVLGFRMCSDQETLVLMCDECDAIWLKPGEVTNVPARFARCPEYVLEGLGVSVKPPASRWATREEIERNGWGAYLAGEL